jgi:hypothetical protein
MGGTTSTPALTGAQKFWFVVVVLAVVGLAARACGLVPASPDRASCLRDFNEKATHSQTDEPYWQHLQDCARQGLLPSGWNDPGYFQ